ncbi:aldehyde dehydrogenase [Ascoidea rubescens DSM 1968]|uniref:Aldehyde dehydrogenase n=1 Tax=Ascoidea rubescens DSM 1968 TaxID=1344418 RepID=A0A1D2VMT4_9ASCO|nr:aldehyde dehydrogenase [Ascoidea rubescens DSM 1968]ODV62909.1 aldehyde dehydrogenase [Ascoidea rubescens DSM 1968]
MTELPEFHELTLPNGFSYKQPTGLFINNKFVPSIKKETIDTIDPSNGEKICSVYAASEEDVDVAVKAAKDAFKTTWRHTSGSDRGRLLVKLSELCERDTDKLAAIEAIDSGKPFEQNAKGDIGELYNVLRYYGGWADKVHGQTIPVDDNKLAYTVHEPYGVCGQIIPWNYPLCMLSWKIGPALAAGNTIVLKSAEQTPLSALYLCNLVVEAGFPAGVVNIISGLGPVAGSALSTHPLVSKIAFTGSTAVGQIIQKAASSNMKAVTLETGGKSPLVIFEDANLEQAVKWAAFGIFFNSGQVCTSNSRVLIQEPIYMKFIEKLKECIDSDYKQGLPFGDDTVMVGPQVSKQQQDRILKYIEIGKKEGAKVFTGGYKVTDDEVLAKGYFVKPTIFYDVTPEMTIFKEEIFGPVVSCIPFKTEEEAIELANDTLYGLAAALFSKDITRAHKVARELEAGMVWINSSNDSDFRVPFGGVKMSGIGRELGEYGLTNYTQTKAYHVNLGLKL